MKNLVNGNTFKLPEGSFSVSPQKRIKAIEEFRNEVSKKALSQFEMKLKTLSMPHCAISIPSWGLIVLPGPGLDDDPYEDHYDWTPGFGIASRHLREYPYYVNVIPEGEKGKRGRMWNRLRDRLMKIQIPDVNERDRLTCWSIVNLTTEHARMENERKRDTNWSVESLQKVINLCRPKMIIAPVASQCLERICSLLRGMSMSEIDAPVEYPEENGRRNWLFSWWDGPIGLTRVGKMYTHPSYWNHNAPEVLTKEVNLILSHLSSSNLVKNYRERKPQNRKNKEERPMISKIPSRIHSKASDTPLAPQKPLQSSKGIGRQYVVESRLEKFKWNGVESKGENGMKSNGIPYSGVFLHKIRIEENAVKYGKAWCSHHGGPWSEWNRIQKTGRWSIDQPSIHQEYGYLKPEPLWWFVAQAPSAHWPERKNLRAYNPITRPNDNPIA